LSCGIPANSLEQSHETLFSHLYTIMAWKILSAIISLCLGTASYFAWSNSKALEEEKKMEARAVANLEQAAKRKEEMGLAEKAKTDQLAALEQERDTTKGEVVKAVAETQEKEAALALVKTNLDEVTKQVDTLQKKVDEAGDIKKLIAQVEALKKDQMAAEGKLANRNQQLAVTQEQLASLNVQIKKFEEAQARATRGVVEPDFTARVAQVFPDWGFVVLSKGNAGGVFAKATLDVKRGNDVVAKLKVKNVEESISVCDVVPGSLAQGDVIRSGDLVVASAEAAPAEAKQTDANAPAPTPNPAPAAGGAMSSDPFGGAPAGGAAPAPAMGSDPFGGAPAAPAAPAPAMGSDPFGAAPAAPTTPATPAEAPPAPSTADPFK